MTNYTRGTLRKHPPRTVSDWTGYCIGAMLAVVCWGLVAVYLWGWV